MPARMWEMGPLVGMQTGQVTMEIRVTFPKKQTNNKQTKKLEIDLPYNPAMPLLDI